MTNIATLNLQTINQSDDFIANAGMIIFKDNLNRFHAL